MKIPINCPVCSLPMKNNFIKWKAGSNIEILKKSCVRRINHSLMFISLPGIEDIAGEVQLFTPIKNGFLSTTWLTDYKITVKKIPLPTNLSLLSPFNTGIDIPYFEPDFSNLQKVISKIKLYTTFS